jgi:DNA-binding response OmpR family regulator
MEYVMKILVAEDDPIIRMVISHFFLKKKFEVISASDGLDALDKFHESPNSYDVLITDIMMPHLNGIELAQKIKNKKSDLRIIAITAGDLRKIIPFESFFDAGFNKPLELDVLHQAVLKITAQSRI